MAPPEGIYRRKGTTNHGSIYEQRVAALLGVKCVLLEDVEDMWMATNIEGLGAFDDVVLFVQKKKGNCRSKEVYLIQIKYKKNRKLYLTAGDNDLTKYQETFLNIKKQFSDGSSPLASCCNFQDIKFILFTNTQIDTSNINTHDYSSGDFSNTGKIFQISQVTNTVYNSDFVKQTYFYYKQIDVSKVTNTIKNETDKYFTNCNVEAITKFFDDWHSGQFVNKVALEKENIQSLILEIVLSNYIPEPTRHEFTKADLWNEVANQFKFIFVKDEDYLAKIWEGVTLQLSSIFDYENIDVSDWDIPLIEARDIKKKMNQYPWKIHHTIRKNKSLYSFKDIYLLLWQISKLPIILKVNTKSKKKDIEAALSKLDSSHSSGRRYIIFGDVISNLHQHSAQFQFLDIDKNTREHFLQNARVSLQGKEAVTLKELKLSDETLKKITPELFIHLLQPITRNVVAEPDYLPRIVQQPTVDVNVLHIPNVIFVIVVDHNTNYAALGRLGTTVPWSIYKQSINKYIQKDLQSMLLCKLINIITLNHIANLKEYKHIEDVINKVKVCQEQTVHYFQFLDENRLKWLHSNRNAKQIKPFIISNSPSDLPDLDLFHYLTFNIISENAGEGKSTLLHFVANNCPTNVWAIELKMREITEYIKNGKFSDIAYFLFSQSNESTDSYGNFSLALFQSLHADGNLLLVIDGIDEVEYNNIKSFLIAVESLGIKTLIATRPSLKDILEEQFDMPLLSLRPLTDTDCKSLIKLTLRNNYEELSGTDINTILQKTSTWSNILGVPLLLKLFVSLINDRVLQDFSEFDIIDLFDSFINEQLKKFASYNKSTIRTLSRSALFVLYKKHAVSRIVNIEEYFEDVDDKIEDFINSKIIEKLDKNKRPIFAHKSLAEFLVAKYLFRHAASNNIPCNFLISMFYKELETVRFFFDMIALKGSGFQDVIIGNATDFYSRNINDFVDKFGRNILHIAATYGNRCELRTMQFLWSGVRIYESYNHVQDNIIVPCHKFVRRTIVPMDFVSELLQQNLDPHKTDNLFKMNVFDFAIESGSLEIIEALFSKKCVKQFEKVDNDVLLFNVVNNGYINIFRELRKKNLQLKISPAIDNLLHIALSSEELEIIKAFNNDIIPLNEPNRFGYTPLVSWLTLLKLYTKHDSLSLNMRTTLPLNDNQLAMLNYLIDKKVNLDAVNCLGETPLHAFCASQQASVVEKLIENGAEGNRKTKLGDIPLHYASRYSLQNVQLLVQKYKTAVDISNNIGVTPLYDAIHYNKVDIMEYLIEEGADVNSTKNYLSPLDAAVSRGHVECARLLLKHGAYINYTETNKTLVFAILFGDLDCIKLLLQHGARLNKELFLLTVSLNRKQIIEYMLSKQLIDITNINMDQLLYDSVRTDDTGLIDILISYGADVNAKNEDHKATPLHLASDVCSEETIKHLIKRKAIVNVENKYGETPLINAANSQRLDILKILINEGSDLKKYGPDALYEAVIGNNNEIFDYLVSVGVEINGFNSNGYAAIHTASTNNLHWVRKIKLFGGDVNLKTVKENGTPLMMAAFDGYRDVLEYLIENGAQIDEEDGLNHHSALIMASQEGHLECVKLLIDKGSNVHKYGPLAIYLAAFKGHVTTMDYLISAGANINGTLHNFHQIPIQIAVAKNNVKTIEYLLDQGADIDIESTPPESFTPLMIATITGSKHVMKYLIEKGAEIDHENAWGQSALLLACLSGQLESAIILISEGSDLRKYGLVGLYFAAAKGHLAIVNCLTSYISK